MHVFFKDRWLYTSGLNTGFNTAPPTMDFKLYYSVLLLLKSSWQKLYAMWCLYAAFSYIFKVDQLIKSQFVLLF